jgi:GNAT acetyltransferase-like protein
LAEVVLERLSTLDRASWDQHLLSINAPVHPQTTLFADYVDHAYGREPLFLRCVDRHLVIAQLLVFRAGSAISWQYGPTFFVDEPLLSTASQALGSWILESGFTVRVGTTRPLASLASASSAAVFLQQFSSDQAEISLAGTFIVRLSDTTVGRFDPSVSRNARKCVRKGVSVTESLKLLALGWHKDTIVSAYASLIDATNARNGVHHGDPLDAARILIEQDILGDSTTLFAMRTGVPLAALNVAVAGAWAYERKQAYTDASIRDSLQVNDLVKLTAIEWARARGLSFFDMMGVRLNGTTKQDGIARYKGKFGGDFVPVLELRQL